MSKEEQVEKLMTKCVELQAKLDKPITEHPDVQRLIIQVETLSRENKRLGKRDCNSTVQILLPTADSPFNKEDCRIVDVGYSDNIYVVECAAVMELQEALQKIETHMEVLIGLEEMARLGADKQPQRDLSQRVMRIFAAHFDRND